MSLLKKLLLVLLLLLAAAGGWYFLYWQNTPAFAAGEIQQAVQKRTGISSANASMSPKSTAMPWTTCSPSSRPTVFPNTPSLPPS